MSSPKKEEKTNKSLFVYTALIFFGALCMILISLMSQGNLNKSEISHQTTGSISEKAANLSEENMLLREDNISLQERLETAEGDVTQLQTENSALKDSIHNYDILLSASAYCGVQNYETATELLLKINLEALSDDAKLLYDNILNQINHAKGE